MYKSITCHIRIYQTKHFLIQAATILCFSDLIKTKYNIATVFKYIYKAL